MTAQRDRTPVLEGARRAARLRLTELFASARTAAPDPVAFDDALNAAGRRVVIHGAGNLGQAAIRLLRASGVEPVALSDGLERVWGTTVEGIVVESPGVVASRHAEDSLVIVAIWSLHHRFRDTQQHLRELGWANILCASALRRRFAAELLPFFAEDSRERVLDEEEHAMAAVDIWADVKSTAQYADQVAWRLTGDMSVLPAPEVPRRYFDETLVERDAARRYLDCGAYDGDTTEDLLRRFGEAVEQVVAVEPDPGTFARLQARLESLPQSLRARVRSICTALGATSGTVRFHADGSEGAAVSAQGTVVVPQVTIDSICAETFHPTCIKMDVEGSEIQVLMGASATLRRDVPVLVVSLYHRQSDAWRIPLLIRELQPKYELFCRSHENDGWEFDCYAVRASERSGE